MGPLALIIVFELIFSGSILGLSTHPQVLKNTKQTISNVLGIQKLAQAPDDSTPDDSTPTDTTAPSSEAPNPTPSLLESTTATPSPTSAPLPADQTPTNLTPIESPAPDQNSLSSPTPTSSPDLFEENSSPAPIPQGQENTLSNPQPSEQPVAPTPSTTEDNTVQTQAVLSPDDLINSPENINTQSITEAKKEDEKISQILDPKEQTLALITFATDKVKDMSNFTKADDFSSTNFAASRFNDQIDQAINNLEKLPPKQQAQLTRQLINFCAQADQVLRTVELSVPQESEQDIQIARGQCQELQL